jgi:hypothetical protein
MPIAWAVRRPVDGVEAVVRAAMPAPRPFVAEGIPHLCYCHTPMRYAWDFESERQRFSGAVRPAARVLM